MNTETAQRLENLVSADLPYLVMADDIDSGFGDDFDYFDEYPDEDPFTPIEVVQALSTALDDYLKTNNLQDLMDFIESLTDSKS